MITFLLLLYFAATRPDWVHGSPEAYPPERFLVAVGTGEDRAAAELRARAGLSADLETRIAAASHGDGTGASAGRDEVAAATARLLERIEIAGVWVDLDHRAHVLAVLDRSAAERTLSELSTATRPAGSAPAAADRAGALAAARRGR
jgi:hypothetical protein